MGEVYKARDTRLGREVAIKVLASAVASDAEHLRRFEQEVRSASALSDPHIVAVFDVGEQGGVHYFASELVEGGDLRQRLEADGVPIRKVLEIAEQIASGLASAHEKGITHRDLKPENILLTRLGQAKIADFGLAKLSDTPDSELSQMPTADRVETTAGVVMGTVSYMSPEQAGGRKLDYRSDQFSFGLILYEMLTGRLAFRRETKGETLAAILRDEPPPIPESHPAVPAPLVWIVERCLAKDPDKRFVSTRDLARDLSAIREHLSDAVSSRAEVLVGKPRRAGFRPAAILAAVLLLGLVVGLVAIGVRTESHPAPVAGPIRFSIPPPANDAFFYGVEVSFLAISPDGSQIAYVASDPQGAQRIFLRPVSAPEARSVPGTEGANSLFFSPDGRSIAFFAGGKLKRVAISGGAAVSICDVALVGPYWSGTWGRGGDILFAGVTRGRGVFRVSASGGVPAEVIPVDPSRGEARIGWPSFLPDGERFLYQLRHLDGHGNLMLAEPGKKPRLVMPMQSAAQYVDPGYLVFAREGALLAQSFDLGRGRVTGEPFSIAEHVRYFLSTGAASFAASRNGTIAYQSQENVRRLTWLARTGRELGFVGPPGNYISISMAPDGRRALSDPTRPGIGTYGVWSFDLERGTETPVTPGPETEVYPIWLPGGTAFAYTADRGSAPQLFRRNLATGKEERLLPSTGFFQWPQDVSPDGRSLVYCEASEHGWFDVWTLPLGGGEPVAFLQAPFHKRDVHFSPDGRYVAMITTESGQPEVYVTAYPGPGERIRVSTGGAHGLRWSREGRELLYVSGDRHLTSVSVRTAPALELGKPTALFALTGPDWVSFDVSPDGTRFLAIVPKVVADEVPLNVIVNWPSAVGR